MSLLDEAMESFVILNKSVIDDGYGGVETIWSDGATIKGAMMFDSSAQMKTAMAAGSTAAYTFTVGKHINLDFHTVLRRESDGAIFRLVTNSDDKKTPNSSSLDMRQYSAEEWRLNG